MNLFERIKKVASPTPVRQASDGEGRDDPYTVHSPVCGKAVPLSEVPDPVFSEGLLGKGAGVWPTDETVCSPVKGTVTALTPTKHAIGVTSESGMEVMVHIGMDTVDMNGKGFSYLVEDGEAVDVGKPLMTFSRDEIKKEGHPDVVVCVVTNPYEFSDVELVGIGEVSSGMPLVKAVPK